MILMSSLGERGLSLTLRGPLALALRLRLRLGLRLGLRLSGRG